MLRLLSSKAQRLKDFWNPSKPCDVGTHWKALDEYFQMSTHLPGFQSFFRIFASFCIGKIIHQQHNAPVNWIPGRGGPGWGGDSEPTFCTIFHSPRPPRPIFLSLIPAPRGTFF